MGKAMTRISPTGKSAVYMLKKVFYRLMMQEKSLDISRPLWKDFVPKVAKKISDAGLMNKPCRIIVEYSEEMEGEKKKLIPTNTTIEVYEKVKELKLE